MNAGWTATVGGAALAAAGAVPMPAARMPTSRGGARTAARVSHCQNRKAIGRQILNIGLRITRAPVSRRRPTTASLPALEGRLALLAGRRVEAVVVVLTRGKVPAPVSSAALLACERAARDQARQRMRVIGQSRKALG